MTHHVFVVVGIFELKGPFVRDEDHLCGYNKGSFCWRFVSAYPYNRCIARFSCKAALCKRVSDSTVSAVTIGSFVSPSGYCAKANYTQPISRADVIVNSFYGTPANVPYNLYKFIFASV